MAAVDNPRPQIPAPFDIRNWPTATGMVRKGSRRSNVPEPRGRRFSCRKS